MISRYTYKQITWIDVENPTFDEIKNLMEEYQLHPIIGDGLMQPTLRPKVEEYGDILYLVLHFPTISRAAHGSKQQEVDFVIGKDFLITVHYEMIDPLHNFSKVFEVNSMLDKSIMGDNAGYLFFYIIKTMYQDMGLELESLRSHIKNIEEDIFNGKERHMVEKLSEIGHKVLDFREATRFHKSVLASLEQSGRRMFGNEFTHYAEILMSEFYKVWESLESLRETTVELKKTNDSLLSYKTNETIRLLTILTFVTLPLEIIPSFFTTNTFITGKSGIYSPEMIHLASIGGAIFLYVLFKYKKWF